MNKIPGVNEVLPRLERLRELVRDFAAREDKLNADFRVRVTGETRAFDAAAAEQKKQLVARLEHTEAAHQADKARWQTRFENRKARINEALKRTRNLVLDQVNEQEGRKKHRLQEKALEAERRRQADQAATQGGLEDFRARLAESRQTFEALERQAQQAFRGYGALRRMLSPEYKWPGPDLAPTEQQLLADLGQMAGRTRAALERFRKLLLPAVFRYVPLWLWITTLVAGCAALVPVLGHYGATGVSYPQAGLIWAVLVVLVWSVYFVGKMKAKAAAAAIAADLAKARRVHDACFEKADARYVQQQEQIKQDFDQTNRGLDQQWREAVKEAVKLRNDRREATDQKGVRILQRNERFRQKKLEQIELDYTNTVMRVQSEGQREARALTEAHVARTSKINSDFEAQWKSLEEQYRNSVQPIYEGLQLAGEAAEKLFPDWAAPAWRQWTPPEQFHNAAKFGRLEVEVEKLTEALPKDKRLTLPCPPTFSVPLVLTYPLQGSLLFETGKSGKDEPISAINNLIFRLLSTNPPGKLSFTIFDPVGLGQNFAGLMHLADYEESHINSRIWTQSNQIEEKLGELNEHMEKVIQMYLRNEYPTITEYNAEAGAVAEKYHFLVVASFPVNFSDTAARRLINIASSGARCGVYTLIHWDQRHVPPQDFVPDELRKNSVCVTWTGKEFELAGHRIPGTRLLLDAPPPPEFATDFLHEVGKTGKDSNRVEVPFQQVAPPEPEIWTEETTDEVRVPIGRSGATKFQYLEIGKGTRQHALIAGKTGSGKSTLFHVIITNLALWCSPEQIEFYLVDFKKGVEFKCYATRRLPHARVVAIESDREFGLSVLQRVDAELRRRGDLFRALGVQDLAGYKRAGGTEALPRSLLMIDEFQEFFTEEDRVSQNASVLLDRIVRQGRAFGIHVLLGSQTLGGAYTLARATIGQMVIRVALQCNEADAYLIMDQDNPAPRLLSRPGEGIYNDSAGAIEGNSPFQTVWLPEEVRDEYLAKLRQRANQNGTQYPGPFVFEGNAPADVRENQVLDALLKSGAVSVPPAARIWLGAPNSIKGPTEAVFQKQSGNSALIVGQNEESALTMLGVGLISLAAQYPVGSARFVLLDSIPPASPQRDFLDRVIQAIPHEIVQGKNAGLSEIMNGLAEELKSRSADEQGRSAPETFLLIQGLQNFKKLRQEDEFGFSSSDAGGPNPAAILQSLISEGPSHGIHVIATFDTYNNVARTLGRKTLGEFEVRILFQMSASDSASLIDAPDAGNLGLHRALLYNDREAYLETFRPYALPGNEWLEEVASHLKRLLLVPSPSSSSSSS